MKTGTNKRNLILAGGLVVISLIALMASLNSFLQGGKVSLTGGYAQASPSAAFTVNGATTGSFAVGQTITYTVTSNIPNTSFGVCYKLNGVTQPCVSNLGTTNASGTWSMNQTEAASYVGSYEDWLVFSNPSSTNSNHITFAVSAASGSSTASSTAPTASITANGRTVLSVPTGTVITYRWSSQGGSQFSSALSIYRIGTYGSSTIAVQTDPCGNTATNSWVISNASGTLSSTIAKCQAHYEYVITYKVTSASGAVAKANLTIAVGQ